MLNLPTSVRVYVCTEPTDMRKSFDSLAAIAHSVFRQNPLSGHLFVFANKRGDKLKILWWSKGGYAIFYKRLEEGTFQLPATDASCAEIDATELAMILDGVDLAADRLHRYTPVAEAG
jgi:transposase